MELPYHPYARLPAARFWKTGVAEIDALDINLGWAPKFPISRESAIVTAGSCFAQHIARALKQHGFNWIDSEPAPLELAAELHAEEGYGVFSFRTGNIYTAALLKQWVRWATGKAVQSAEVFVEGERVHDPFRPSFPREGYATAEQMRQARTSTLEAIARTVGEADVLIFTLGLTETWRHRDGAVYPMCPGTIRGQFSPEAHVFHNCDVGEVERDLAETFDELRSFNPRIRFLLTVSPVPLTATATKQHVLTATTYSKSVLRSAAGHLAQTRDDVDYFPSYELIASAPFRGRFFEKNMRSVTPRGVEFVMSQFMAAVDAGGEITRQDSAQQSGGTTQRLAREALQVAGESSEICDEIILESWSRSRSGVREAPDGGPLPNIVLVGDSQIGMIAKALDGMGIRYAGGAIMNASAWDGLELVASGDERLFLFSRDEPRAMWDEICRSCLARWQSEQKGECWVITNIGTHTPTLLVNNSLEKYLRGVYRGFLPESVPTNDLRYFISARRTPHVQLVKSLVAAGYSVVWVTDPPTQDKHIEPLCAAFDAILAEYFGSTGCSVVNAREWVRGLGGLPDSFRSAEIDAVTGRPDWMHGSPEYYRCLVEEILRRHSIRSTLHTGVGQDAGASPPLSS